MQCPITAEQWERYQETGDSLVARHLASCAVCRREVERYARLRVVLAGLDAPDCSEVVAQRVAASAPSVPAQTLSCHDTLIRLEAWREGELDHWQAFLVEDHLLWCAACAHALDSADAVSAVLLQLPALDAPPAIAACLAEARAPWWRQLLHMPAIPRWQAGVAVNLAALFMLVIGLSLVITRPASNPSGGQPAAPVAIPPATPAIPVATVPVAQPASAAPASRQALGTPKRAQVRIGNTHADRVVQPSVMPAAPSVTPITPPEETSDSPALAPQIAAISTPALADKPRSDMVKDEIAYSAKEDLVALAADERMMEIDESNMAAADQVRLAMDRPRWVAQTTDSWY